MDDTNRDLIELNFSDSPAYYSTVFHKHNSPTVFCEIACEQAFSRAGWGDGEAKRPVDRPLGPPFHGTRCASDPDASAYWREH